MAQPNSPKPTKTSSGTWDNQLYLLGKRWIVQLFMMLKTAQLYEAKNNAFIHALDLLHKDLTVIYSKLGSFTFQTVELNFFINEEKVKTDLTTHTAYQFLSELFAEKRIGGIRFVGMPEIDELKNFIAQLLAFQAPPLPKDADPAEKSLAAQLNQILSNRGVSLVETIEGRPRSLGAQNYQTVVSNKRRALKNYVRAIGVMKDAVQQFESRQVFDIRKSKRIVYNLVNHSFDEGYSFVGLAAIKNYDEYTFNHSVNVCVISISFGQNLGLDKRQLTDLGVGALFHDFGKLQVPREILNKKGSLADEEWMVMQKHPIMAIKPLLPLRGATDMDVRKVIPAFEHHRNYDLSGYPPSTIRKPLNFYSKVVAIADAFDAMTSKRAYQKVLIPAEALQILIKGAGRKFDPVLIKAFINTMGLYPAGSLVLLTSGEYGIVSEISKNVKMNDRPKVLVVLDKQGAPLTSTRTVDLAETETAKMSIVKAVNPEDYKVNVAHYLFNS